MKCDNSSNRWCKSKEAEYVCEECGTKYCSRCAAELDFECGCIEPPRIVRIENKRKKK